MQAFSLQDSFPPTVSPSGRPPFLFFLHLPCLVTFSFSYLPEQGFPLFFLSCPSLLPGRDPSLKAYFIPLLPFLLCTYPSSLLQHKLFTPHSIHHLPALFSPNPSLTSSQAFPFFFSPTITTLQLLPQLSLSSTMFSLTSDKLPRENFRLENHTKCMFYMLSSIPGTESEEFFL